MHEFSKALQEFIPSTVEQQRYFIVYDPDTNNPLDFSLTKTEHSIEISYDEYNTLRLEYIRAIVDGNIEMIDIDAETRYIHPLANKEVKWYNE